MSVVTARPVFSILMFWDERSREWSADTDTTTGSALHMNAMRTAWVAAVDMNDRMPEGPGTKEERDAKH